MEFNPKKSVVLTFFPNKVPKTKRNDFVFVLGGGTVKVVREGKYLGIVVSDSGDLSLGTENCGQRSYRSFLKATLDRAERRLAIVRSYGFHQDGLEFSTGIFLYKSLIRPILEFGFQVVY